MSKLLFTFGNNSQSRFKIERSEELVCTPCIGFSAYAFLSVCMYMCTYVYMSICVYEFIKS